MIWIMQKELLKGYVPKFKKEFTEAEIREMSSWSKDEWSALSRFVMNVQRMPYADRTVRGIIWSRGSVSLDFSSWECFYPCDDIPKESKETYIKQIHDVFQNLTLYEVECYTMDGTDGTAVGNREVTLKSNKSHARAKKLAISNYEYFQELLKMFCDRGLELTNEVFKAADSADVLKLQYDRSQTVLKF